MIIVVTGGTSGIGASVVEELSKDNKVISLSRNPGRGVVRSVKYMECDITKEKDIESAIETIDTQYGRIDVLINSAGNMKPGGIEDISLGDWGNSIEMNLTGTYAVIKHCIPLLKMSKTGTIINVSSISSTISGNSVAYCVCKAGLDMLTKVLAKDLAQYNIRVNSVNPGLVTTGFQVTNRIMAEDEYSDYLHASEDEYPLGIGSANDVRDAITYLASSKAKWITGVNLVVDGGRSIN